MLVVLDAERIRRAFTIEGQEIGGFPETERALERPDLVQKGRPLRVHNLKRRTIGFAQLGASRAQGREERNFNHSARWFAAQDVKHP